MSLIRLIFKEIRMRFFTFVVAVLAVVIAVAVLVGQFSLLQANRIQTDQILDAKQKKLEEDMAVLEDDMRKIMLELGFNLMILPEGQQLEDYHDQGYAVKDMPEDYVTMLSESSMVSIQHLLPFIEEKTRWPEQGQRTVILNGTRGEVPYKHRDPKKPLQDAVESGTAVLGFEIWDSLGLKPGDTITLMGKDFKVARCEPQRGSKKDITIWTSLEEAQQLLGREGRISGIQAIKCLCAGSGIDGIRKEIRSILPADLQVIELENLVTTRAKARQEAQDTAEKGIEQEKLHRENIQNQMEQFASLLIPLVILGAVVSIALLTLLNARTRTVEFGVLRAIGFRNMQILLMLLVRAIMFGLIGSVGGYLIGLFAGAWWSEIGITADTLSELFNGWLLACILIGAPLLTALAALPVAVFAIGSDPADVLRKDI